MKTLLPTIVLLTIGSVLAGLFSMYTYDRQRHMQHEIKRIGDMLETRDAVPAMGPAGAAQRRLLMRLDALERSLTRMDTKVVTLQQESVRQNERLSGSPGAKAKPESEPQVLASGSSPGPARFSDRYEDPQAVISQPSTVPAADRTYDSLYTQIVSEGESPTMTQQVDTGLKQLQQGYPKLASELQFSSPVCSEFRCAVKADVTATPFSTNKLKGESDFQAEDAFQDFIHQLQNSIDTSMSRKTQVSVVRNGNDLVLNIFPKR